MAQNKSLKKEFPPYNQLKTVPALKKVATNMALMKKASIELKHLQTDFIKYDMSDEDLRIAMEDIAYFATEGAKNANSAIATLKATQIKMKKYLKEL